MRAPVGQDGEPVPASRAQRQLPQTQQGAVRKRLHVGWGGHARVLSAAAALSCMLQPSHALESDTAQRMLLGGAGQNLSTWSETPRACPTNWTNSALFTGQQYPWVEDPGRSCATLVSNATWIVPDPWLACSYPSWRLGPGAALVRLTSASHAQAVAATLPQGTAAWVGLMATSMNGTQPLRWTWLSLPSAQYAVSDPLAWEGDGVTMPAPVEGFCAVLLPSGRLAPRNCTHAAGSFAACEIPACTCASAEACNTSSLLSGWRGVGCLQHTSTWAGRVNSYHVFQGSAQKTGNLAPTLQEQRDVGCGTAFNSSQEASSVLSSLAFLPGDTLRMCGEIPASSTGEPHAFLQALRFGGGPAWLEPCSDEPVPGRRASCQQISFLNDPYMGGGNEQVTATLKNAGYAHAKTIAVGLSHTCVIVTEPWGAVRCWGDRADAPRDLGPAIAIAAYERSTCAISAGEGRVRCWGAWLGEDVPAGLKNVVALDVGFHMACAVQWIQYGKLNHGTVVCWGGNNIAGRARSIKDEPVIGVSVGADHFCAHMEQGGLRCFGQYANADFSGDVIDGWSPQEQAVFRGLRPYAFAGGAVFTCAAVRAQGSSPHVQCLGTRGSLPRCAPHTCMPVEPVPPLASLSAGPAHVCGVIAGTGGVQCWGDESVQHMVPPPDLPPVEQVEAGETHSCVILQATGQVLCWGSNDKGQAQVPPSLPAALRASDLVAMEVSGDVAAMKLGLQSQAWLYVTGVEWGPSYALIHRARLPPGAEIGMDTEQYPLPHLYQGLPGLWVPAMEVVVQPSLAQAAVLMPCSTTVVQHAYQVRCNTGGLWPSGGILKVWNGTGYSQRVYSREGGADNVVMLRNIEAAASEFTVGAGIPQLSRASAAASLSAAITAQNNGNGSQAAEGEGVVVVEPTAMAVVRAGDTVTLYGSGFGLNAAFVQELPWWTPSSPGQLRSCLHLSWWASSAAYHDDSACVCNGQEDWLGEGELPLSAILEWNNTLIRFSVPLGDGIREVRPCVEGRGPGAATPPRSESSLFIVYDPPRLTDLKPSAFVDNTETDMSLYLSLTMVSAGETSVLREWTHCTAEVNVSAYGQQAKAGTYGFRMYLDPPLHAGSSFGITRHCLSMPVLRDSIGTCWASISLATVRFWTTGQLERLDPLHVAGLGHCIPSVFAANVRDPVRSVAEVQVLPQVGDGELVSQFVGRAAQLDPQDGDGAAIYAASAAILLSVPVPDPVPNAVLRVEYSVSVYDGGVWLELPRAFSTLAFRRTEPVLRGVNPNPLVLGASGDAQGQPVTLTLYGLGFRTAEEVMNPRHGLQGLDPRAAVWIDDVPCGNVTVTRTDSRFAYVTCSYPAALVGGGDHEVTLEMIGFNSSLRPRDGTNAALRSTCAPGFYGLFSEAEHKLCLPCPRGAFCAGGLGLIPEAKPGFYNLGLPPGYSAALGLPLGQNVSSLPLGVAGSGISCPPGPLAAAARRGIACIMPCEPAQACLGDNQCAEGYVSLPPVYRCGQCAPGFFRSSGICARCPVVGLASLIILVLIILAAIAAMFLLSSASIRMCTMNMILEYYQILSLLSGPNLPWPSAVDKVMHSMSLLRLNLEVSAPECYTNIELSPDAKLLIVLGMPLFVLGSGASAYALIALCKTCLHGGKAQSRASRVSATKATGLVGKLSMLLNKGSLWSHGPPICRTVLKLLGALYLPVIVASLEVWNCTPTDPPDGNDYLAIIFEQCGLPGGLQERMAPYSLMGLALFGVLYPCLLGVFYFTYHDVLVEDQLLKAAGTGDDRRSNPRGYALRKHTSPLYVHFRPGYHWAGLLTLARRAMVCVCALMLHKSPVLLSGGIVFVVAVGLTITALVQPFMTPGPGYAMAVAEYGAKVTVGRSELHQRLQKHFTATAALTRIPVIMDLAAGKTGSSDAAAASRPWWSFAVDWNILEAELQLSVLLTGMLAIMYNAALQSVVYTENVVPVVTGLFFLLLIVALCHTLVTVLYDVLLQARWAMRDLLGIKHGLHATLPQDYEPGEAPVGLTKARLVAQRSDSVVDIAVELRQLFWLCCCPRSFNRAWAAAKAREEEEEAARTGRQAGQQNGHGLDVADAGVISEWSSPLNQHRPSTHAPSVAAAAAHPAVGRSAHVAQGQGLGFHSGSELQDPLEDPFNPIKPVLSTRKVKPKLAQGGSTSPSPTDTAFLSPSSGSSDSGDQGQGRTEAEAGASMHNPLRVSHAADSSTGDHGQRGPRGLSVLLQQQAATQQG